ncbi:MAG: hypothetical protein ACRDZ8_19375 [Acidimicrobiales bacterium]
MPEDLTPAEWDERFRVSVRDATRPMGRSTTTVREIYLKGTYPSMAVFALFDDERRPGCRFGFGWEIDGFIQTLSRWFANDPESLATMFWVNFLEAARLVSASQGDSGDEILWLNDGVRGFGSAHIEHQYSWTDRDQADSQLALNSPDAVVNEDEGTLRFEKVIDGRLRTVVIAMGKRDPDDGQPLGILTSYTEDLWQDPSLGSDSPTDGAA